MAKIREAYIDEVKVALELYIDEVEESGLSKQSQTTYIDHAKQFVRWLDDDFTPGILVRGRRGRG